MNLKESFRYQNFLEVLMRSAYGSLTDRSHCLKVTKTHLRNKANPDADDIIETVDAGAFFPNDDVMSFMGLLILERQKLTDAIGRAKSSLSFDLDAAIETNKFRQQVNLAIKEALRHTPRKVIESGRDFKFNVEGNQTAYYYDIETVSEEAYDKVKAKDMMRTIIADADKTSSAIDAALINTTVEYTPLFDVNDSFEDVMEAFIEMSNTKAA